MHPHIRSDSFREYISSNKVSVADPFEYRKAMMSKDTFNQYIKDISLEKFFSYDYKLERYEDNFIGRIKFYGNYTNPDRTCVDFEYHELEAESPAYIRSLGYYLDGFSDYKLNFRNGTSYSLRFTVEEAKKSFPHLYLSPGELKTLEFCLAPLERMFKDEINEAQKDVLADLVLLYSDDLIEPEYKNEEVLKSLLDCSSIALKDNKKDPVKTKEVIEDFLLSHLCPSKDKSLNEILGFTPTDEYFDALIGLADLYSFDNFIHVKALRDLGSSTPSQKIIQKNILNTLKHEIKAAKEAKKEAAMETVKQAAEETVNKMKEEAALKVEKRMRRGSFSF